MIHDVETFDTEDMTAELKKGRTVCVSLTDEIGYLSLADAISLHEWLGRAINVMRQAAGEL